MSLQTIIRFQHDLCFGFATLFLHLLCVNRLQNFRLVLYYADSTLRIVPLTSFQTYQWEMKQMMNLFGFSVHYVMLHKL